MDKQLLKVILIVALSSMIPMVHSAEAPVVQVADSYLEMRTGPGRGFPVFHIAEQAEQIQILRQKTNWYLVRIVNTDIEGWAKADELVRTQTPDGEAINFRVIGKDDYVNRNWEISVSYGDFSGASVISFTGDWVFTHNLAIEARFSQVLGTFSDSILGTVGIQHQPWPEWRISPFFGVGTGMIKTEPNSTIVQTEDRTDQLLYVGVGTRFYLTQRFFLRAEYNNYNILTSRDKTEEIDEWKLGTAFFF